MSRHGCGSYKNKLTLCLFLEGWTLRTVYLDDKNKWLKGSGMGLQFTRSTSLEMLLISVPSHKFLVEKEIPPCAVSLTSAARSLLDGRIVRFLLNRKETEGSSRKQSTSKYDPGVSRRGSLPKVGLIRRGRGVPLVDLLPVQRCGTGQGLKAGSASCRFRRSLLSLRHCCIQYLVIQTSRTTRGRGP